MINKIIGTIGSRVYVGIVLLIILGLHSKNLGAEILGKIAIFRLGLTINHLFASIFSGPAVVYLGNRISINRLVLPTIFWVIASTLLLSVLQTVFHLVSDQYFFHLILLSILYSSQSFLEQILLSKQKIKIYNISSVIYHTLLLLSCLLLIFSLHWKTEDVFFYSMYTALIGCNVFLFATTWSNFNLSQFTFNSKIARIIFNYGFWVQINNFVQTLNYRFSLILLDLYWGKKIVGYFSAALQLAEAIWIIAKSLATVQYTKIASNKSKAYAIDLTLLLSKASFIFSFFAAIILLLIPEKTIGFYLGKDFTNVKETLFYLIPGILFFSVSLIYCHYFSGLGKFFYNSAGSIISLVIIVIGGMLVIPDHGSKAAALVNSAGLLGMLIFNIIILTRNEQIKFTKLFAAKKDIQRSIRILKDYLKIN